MSEIDVTLQRIFKDYMFVCLLFWFLVCGFRAYYPSFKQFVLRRQLLESELAYEIALKYQRGELLAQLYDITSADSLLRNRGLIRIVDIGIKTGINLRYFPNSTHVVAVDTMFNLQSLFAPFANAYNMIKLEKCVEFDGDMLSCIPNNHADVVVATFVLCKSKTGNLLNEIYRILAPGGRYYFIEHTIDLRDPKLSNLQNILSNSGVWPFLFDGCKLNIDMKMLIMSGPFKSVECEHVIHRFTRPFALKYVRTHIFGCAVK